MMRQYLRLKVSGCNVPQIIALYDYEFVRYIFVTYPRLFFLEREVLVHIKKMHLII